METINPNLFNQFNIPANPIGNTPSNQGQYSNSHRDYSKINNHFDPLLHQPPKYDLHGRQKQTYIIPGSDPRNILKDQNQIKNPWEYKNNNQQVNSYTELVKKRRMDKIPDPSFDLDGDGFVGGRDYVISKRFDVNKDGKLDENERKAAIDAIKNNIEDEYVWNLENQGVGRPCRILQKVNFLSREVKS